MVAVGGLVTTKSAVVVFVSGTSVLVERGGEDAVGKLEDLFSVVGFVDAFIVDGSMSVE